MLLAKARAADRKEWLKEKGDRAEVRSERDSNQGNRRPERGAADRGAGGGQRRAGRPRPAGGGALHLWLFDPREPGHKGASWTAPTSTAVCLQLPPRRRPGDQGLGRGVEGMASAASAGGVPAWVTAPRRGASSPGATLLFEVELLERTERSRATRQPAVRCARLPETAGEGDRHRGEARCARFFAAPKNEVT